MKWRSLQTMDHEHEVHRRRSALQPWLSRAEGDALPRGHLDHDGRCGRVRVVGRFLRGACPTHFLHEIRLLERESSYEHLFLLIYRRNRRICRRRR